MRANDDKLRRPYNVAITLYNVFKKFQMKLFICIDILFTFNVF